MICTLCNSKLDNKINNEFFLCDNCNGIVKHEDLYLDEESEKSRYETHNNDVFDSRYRNFVSPITDIVLKNFATNKIGLDFGCGSGPVISQVLQENNYVISQYDPYFFPDIKVLEQKYDFIVCCEVVEHLNSPNRTFKLLSNLLETGGELLIMTLLYNQQINLDKWFYLKDPTHIFIYQKQTFSYIAREYNFSIIEIGDRLVRLRKI